MTSLTARLYKTGKSRISITLGAIRKKIEVEMAKNKKNPARAQRNNQINTVRIQNANDKSKESTTEAIRRSVRIANRLTKLKNDPKELQTVAKTKDYSTSSSKKSRKRSAAATTQNESTVKRAKHQTQQRNGTPKVHEHNVRKSAVTINAPSRPYIHLDITASCEQLIFSDGTLTTNSFTAPDSYVEKPAPTNLNVAVTKSDEIPKCRRRRRREPSVQISFVQPMLRRRTVSILNDVSDFQRALKALHLSMLPEILPCREKELKEISESIKTNILENRGGCMYVSGVPGTGKSSTVAEVIRSLQLQSDRNSFPRFELIQMNGMQLSRPQQAYVHIYRHFFGINIRWEDAVERLDQFFTSSQKQRKLTILVADEFDMLKSPGQRVIYNILNWSMTPGAQLFVMAVGNIVDPGGMGGISSRLGATRFVFQPYTQSQLQTIVLARLTEIDIYETDAVELVARKIASMSGDCRRALDICRRATEIGAKECAGGEALVITKRHVVKAFDEMIINPKLIAIKGCSKYEKFFLQAVGAEISRTGADETVLYQVYRQFETICLSNGVKVVPEPGIALRISSRLGSSRLLICEHSNQSIHQKIMLNVTFDELRYAFN